METPRRILYYKHYFMDFITSIDAAARRKYYASKS